MLIWNSNLNRGSWCWLWAAKWDCFRGGRQVRFASLTVTWKRAPPALGGGGGHKSRDNQSRLGAGRKCVWARLGGAGSVLGRGLGGAEGQRGGSGSCSGECCSAARPRSLISDQVRRVRVAGPFHCFEVHAVEIRSSYVKEQNPPA